jgi:hypothetical protein
VSVHAVDTPWSGVSTLTFDRVLDNMRLVVEHFGRPVSDDPATIRLAFFEEMNRVQPWRFNYQRDPAVPVITLGDEPWFEAETLRHLMLVDELPDGWRYQPHEYPQLRQGVEAGRAILREIAPETLAVLDLLIGELVFGKEPKKSGASIGDVIGVIWLGPKDSWTAQRYAEALAHELVHNILFLEDMTHSIFTQSVDDMSTGEGLITSAILQRPRSYDKAYHSALVSLVVVLLARALGESAPRFDGLIEPTRVTIDQMLAKPQYLTENGYRILEEMDRLWRALATK